MNVCKDCGIQKPLDAFYKNYKKCKECVNLKIECNVCKKLINRNNFNKHFKNMHTDIHPQVYSAGAGAGADADGAQEVKTKIVAKPTKSPTKYPSENKNRTLIVGPCFCGKTYLLLKILTGKGDFVDPQDIVIITRSPEQYENSEYCIEENINDLEEY